MILLLLLFISLTQGICNWIPEANPASRVCSFAGVLYLKFMLHVLLFPMINAMYFHLSTFRSMCPVPNMAVFYISLISCFTAMLLGYFPNDFGMVTISTIITGIIYFLTFHIVIIIVIIIIITATVMATCVSSSMYLNFFMLCLCMLCNCAACVCVCVCVPFCLFMS